jgi:hypothetical protein
MRLRRRDFVSSVCLQCVLFVQYIKEVNGHTSGQTGGASSGVYSGNAAANSARDAEVNSLLKRAEQRLKALDGVSALTLFEQAAQIVHASEVEVGIVRAHLQAGQFQRALSFCAHASGAHLDEIAPSLLYAHLLACCGQTGYSAKLLAECRVRFGETFVKKVTVKLEPYFDAAGLPTKAKMLGSGLRLPPSSLVTAPTSELIAVPAEMLRGGVKSYWIRYGNGFLSAAAVELAKDPNGLALLRVKQPLFKLNDEPLYIADKAAFPGSVTFGVHFKQQLALSWPLLWTSFVGEPSARDSGRRLVDASTAGPTALGATMFDQTGAAIGLLSRSGGSLSKSQFIPLTELGLSFPSSMLSSAKPKLASDQVYQIAFQNIVQVIGS